MDEVDELPPDTQVSFLRALQERQFEGVGGTQSIHVDVIGGRELLELFSVDESWLSKESRQPASQVERCRLSFWWIAKQ